MKADFKIWLSPNVIRDGTETYIARRRERQRERVDRRFSQRGWILYTSTLTALILGIGWFFDEPLFTWMGAIFGVLFALMFALHTYANALGNRNSRRAIEKLTRAMRGNALPIPVHVDLEGLGYGTPSGIVKLSWSDFQEVIERPSYWVPSAVRPWFFLTIPTADVEPAVLEFIRGRIVLFGHP